MSNFRTKVFTLQNGKEVPYYLTQPDWCEFHNVYLLEDIHDPKQTIVVHQDEFYTQSINNLEIGQTVFIAVDGEAVKCCVAAVGIFNRPDTHFLYAVDGTKYVKHNDEMFPTKLFCERHIKNCYEEEYDACYEKLSSSDLLILYLLQKIQREQMSEAEMDAIKERASEFTHLPKDTFEIDVSE